MTLQLRTQSRTQTWTQSGAQLGTHFGTTRCRTLTLVGTRLILVANLRQPCRASLPGQAANGGCGRARAAWGHVMPMNANDIERLIKESIPDAQVTIRDLAGDGDHYAATVISASFRGKSRVQQHQLVYAALKGQMGGVLHALALQTGVPQS